MEHAVSDGGAPPRFNTALISAFAIAAVLIAAALGICSVIAFCAALSVQEMAIRIAVEPNKPPPRQLEGLSSPQCSFAYSVLACL
jgi:hypothetical protein